MTASELLSTLEVALGGICPAPRAMASAKLVELPVSGEIFEKLLRHWTGLPFGSRPKLRGLTLSRESPARRQLVLELGPRMAFLLLSVDPNWKPRSLAPLWPHASWWEEELCGFDSAAGAGFLPDAEVTWRRG